MKILMILESEFPPDVRVEKEIRTLIKSGHEIYLIATSKNKNPKIEKSNKLEIHRIYQSSLMHKLSALALSLPFYFNFWKKHIQLFLNRNEIDVIHLHDLPLASVVYKLGKEHKIPVVLDLHENRPEIMKLYAHTNTVVGKLLISIKKWEYYQKIYSRLFDRLILITPEAKDYYLEKYHVNPKTTDIVPNYADIEHLNLFQSTDHALNKYKSKFMLVYFGDTGLRRGTLTIIEAAKLLKEQSKFHFVLIGDSKEQQLLKNKIAAYELNNVELTGYLNFEQIASYILASKGGLCPFLRNIHHDTTFANKLFQYMYFGKPVIVSNCPSQAKIVENNNCGLIFEAGNSSDLAEKIFSLSQQANYSKLGENGHRAILNKFNTKEGNKPLIEMYNSLVK